MNCKPIVPDLPRMQLHANNREEVANFIGEMNFITNVDNDFLIFNYYEIGRTILFQSGSYIVKHINISDNCFSIWTEEDFKKNFYTSPDFVKIPVVFFKVLIESDAKMTALESGGVDNWEWYGDSLKDFALLEGFNDIDDFIETLFIEECKKYR